MSIHNIAIVRRYRVQCKDCTFSSITKSAGEAERRAEEHLEFVDLALTCEDIPNYDHIVEIQETTLVGRNLSLT